MDDLFLTTKGKQLRNRQKKLDKIAQTERSVKKGEITPTDAQKEMIASKSALQHECKELTELCELYIRSNPDSAKPKESAEPTEQKPTATKPAEITLTDAKHLVTAAISVVARMLQVKSKKDHSDKQRKTLEHLQQRASEEELFMLAAHSNDLVLEGGLSFQAINLFVEHQHHVQQLERDDPEEEEALGEAGLAMCDDFDIFDDTPEPTPSAPKQAEVKAVVAEKKHQQNEAAVDKHPADALHHPETAKSVVHTAEKTKHAAQETAAEKTADTYPHHDAAEEETKDHFVAAETTGAVIEEGRERG